MAGRDFGIRGRAEVKDTLTFSLPSTKRGWLLAFHLPVIATSTAVGLTLQLLGWRIQACLAAAVVSQVLVGSLLILDRWRQ